MLGIYPESIYLDPIYTTDKNSLFKALQILSYNHCILGCKLDFEMFTGMDEARKKNYYNTA